VQAAISPADPVATRRTSGRKAHGPERLVGLGRVTAVKVTAADEANAVVREIFAAVRDPAVRALPAVQKFFIERAGLVMRSSPRSPHYTAFGREMKRLEALHLEAIARPPPLALHSPGAALPAVQNKRSISASSQTDDLSGLPAAAAAAAAVARPAKRLRRSPRLRPAAEIIEQLEQQVERMETARNRLYVQKSRAVQKVGKKEDEIDEMEKEGENRITVCAQHAVQRKGGEAQRVQDVQALKVAEQKAKLAHVQLKKEEKEKKVAVAMAKVLVTDAAFWPAEGAAHKLPERRVTTLINEMPEEVSMTKFIKKDPKSPKVDRLTA
jgi:hypothetical protein